MGSYLDEIKGKLTRYTEVTVRTMNPETEYRTWKRVFQETQRKSGEIKNSIVWIFSWLDFDDKLAIIHYFCRNYLREVVQFLEKEGYEITPSSADIIQKEVAEKDEIFKYDRIWA